MKKNKQLVPKRRFKEFENDGEWIQYNLEDLVHVNSGRDYKHLSPGTIPVYGTGGYMVNVNEALSSSTDAIGIGRKGTIDRPYLLEAPFWTVDTLFYAFTQENSNLYFMVNIFKNVNWNAQQETSGVPSLTRTAINNVEVFVPKNEEQEKIGLFTKKLERIIRQEQLKIRKLKDLKESYLTDLFPKEGEIFPKKRFEGFTEPWEYYNLGDIVQITMGQSPSSANYTDNPDNHILVQGNADMKNGKVVPRVWTTQITKQAEKGDLILSVRAPVGDIGRTDYDVVLGRGVAAVKGNDFIYQTLSRMKENGYWNNLITGSTFESINSNDIRDARIAIPSEKEQQKIGEYFNKIDKQINLEEQKLEKLEQLKQAYLNELFV